MSDNLPQAKNARVQPGDLDKKQLIRELQSELATLTDQQNEARRQATYVLMDADQARQYETRRALIQQIADRLLHLRSEEAGSDVDQADQRRTDHATLIGELNKVLATLSNLQNVARSSAAFVGMTQAEIEEYDLRNDTIQTLRNRLLQLEKDEAHANHCATPHDGTPPSR